MSLIMSTDKLVMGLRVVRCCSVDREWLQKRSVDHEYDYKPNRTPRSAITSINYQLTIGCLDTAKMHPDLTQVWNFCTHLSCSIEILN